MSEDEITIRTGAAGNRLAPVIFFGFITLSGGLGFLLLGASGSDIDEKVFLAIGGIFAFVGGFMTLWRRWIILDRKRGTVEVRTGALFPWRSRTQQINPDGRVTLDRLWGDDGGWSIFVTGLKKKVLIEHSANRGKAVKRAEEIASFLNLELTDKSRGETVVRKPEDFGKTLKERRATETSPPSLPDPPATLASRIEIDPHTGSVEIRIPAPGFNFGRKARILFGCLWMVFFVLFMAGSIYLTLDLIASGEGGTFMGIGFIVFAIILCAIGFLVLILSPYGEAKRKSRVVISREGITLFATRFSSKEHRGFMPADEIAAIRLIGWEDTSTELGRRQKMLEIKNTRGWVLQFGDGLSGEELDWIRSLIESRLRDEPSV